jgi:mono/diheme cytochrome c family protein
MIPVRLALLASVGVLVTIGALLSTDAIRTAAPSGAQRSSSTVVGDPARGEQFFSEYCSSCHTLKAARATGRVGPNLDKLKPSYQRVVKQVTNPRGAVPLSMITFGPDTFTASDIHDIAAFVFISTHR